MKTVCISDTHCQLKQIEIPDGDLLIHAGDLTYHGQLKETSKELINLGKLPHKVKIYISGNHDWLGQKNPTLVKQLCEDNGIIYLQDSGTEIEGFKIWGSPVTPWFFDWAFNVNRGPDIKKYWDAIPDDCNILITHGPPYQILDSLMDGGQVGCVDLLNRVNELKHLKLHVFGHIHFAYGKYQHLMNSNPYFVNASICDEGYEPVHHPIVIEL